MNMTVSIFKKFLSCPACALAQYRGRVLGDLSIKPEWDEEGSRPMACGSLVDAIVTKGYKPDPFERVTVDGVYGWFKSSYDDGRKNASFLINKSGGWNSYAQVSIEAANRLLSDESAKRLVDMSSKQVKVRWSLGGFDWSGDIDLIGDMDGKLYITDLKHPSSVEDGWIISGGKNVKARWEDVWSYWFQLSAYRYGVENGETEGFLSTSFMIGQGILYATNSTPSKIGYIPVSNQVDAFVSTTSHRTLDGGISKLDAIRSIVEGESVAGRCGICDYCKATSRVDVPDLLDDKIPQPVFGDEWGMNFTEN